MADDFPACDVIETTLGRFGVRRGGAGAPMVLLHPAMGDASEHFRRVWPFLARNYSLLAIDLPGCGDSQALKRPTLLALVNAVDSVIVHHGLERPHILGAEFGATLARVYAAERPQRARSATLIGGGATPTLIERALHLLPRRRNRAEEALRVSEEKLRASVADATVVTEDWVKLCDRAAPAEDLIISPLRGPFLRNRPPVPTLMLWGDQDRITPPTAGMTIAGDIPSAIFHQLRRVGHWPAVEAPELVADNVTAFLS